jgi:LmbE family N-acetylglucosaminyl deacetylase
MRMLLPTLLLALIAPALGAPMTTVNQKLMKVDLMVVTAHPDDEGMAAAQMARLALDGGKKVCLVTATHGEGGGNSTGKESGPALGLVREEELRRCLAVLGVQNLQFLDAVDFAYTESATATLERWGHERTLGQLVRLVRLMRPEVIVTMDPAPTGGQHGNHQVAGRLATEAYEAAADPKRFPEQLKGEGLPVWRARKLYYSSFSGNGATLTLPTDTVSPARGKSYDQIAGDALRNHRSQRFDKFFGQHSAGAPRPSRFTLVKSRVPLLPQEEHDLLDGCDLPAASQADLSAWPESFQVAAGQPFTVHTRLTNETGAPLHIGSLELKPPQGSAGWETRLVAEAPGTIPAGQALDLSFQVRPRDFAPGQRAVLTVEASGTTVFPGVGRALREEEKWRLRQPVEVEAAAPVTVLVRPSFAVEEYRQWARSQGIERLIARLPAHVPVTLGATSEVVVEVLNRGRTPAEGEARLEVPAGWRLERAAQPYRLAAGQRRALTFRVSAPADVTQRDYDVVAVAGPARDPAVLEALPQLIVRRLRSPLPVDAEPAKWEATGFPAHAIPATALVQGQVAGPQEASGRFFVGYDDQALQVLVDVTDDTVVANIAPDDIKAHWRSTSTEIAIDPAPRSENTLGCFKLGIFPADTAGHVRAARDADANPGPVDQVDPGVRLASRRTPTGYVVEARIPFASLSPKGRPGVRPVSGARLGFDVILFHAGKKEAAIGEDINKARLAWAFRGGIWGRPISWGAAVLE